MSPTENARRDPIEVAGRVVESRFPDALCAFAAGSFRRGEETATSDIDLVVILKGNPVPFREAFRAEGWPVEAFVHSRDSVGRYFVRDAESRTPSLPTMCLEGHVLRDADGMAEEIRADAQRLLDAGPLALTSRQIEDRRYGITDLVDDFVGCDRRHEGFFIAADLVESATELLLALHRQWSGHGKWLLRALGRFDPARRAAVAAALDAYCAGGNKVLLIDYVDGILREAGGPLFEGYRRDGETE